MSGALPVFVWKVRVMRLARIAVLGVALGSAVVAGLLAKGMVTGTKSAETPEAKQFDTMEVLVASRDIALGSKVSASSLQWVDWPKAAVNSRYITRSGAPDALNKLTGAAARSQILSGEPIVKAKLVTVEGNGFMSAILKSGMRAISVKISPETGAGGFILPNDHVDVILTRQMRSAGREQFRSETILRNVRVLAIDQAIDTSKKGAEQVAVGKTATLELWPAQAESLALAESMGSISLSLRSLTDAGSNGKTDEAGRTGRRKGTVTVLRYGVASSVQTGR